MIVGVLTYVVSIADGDIGATGIVLTDSPDPVFLGNDLTYDLDVSNSGTSTVTDVNLIVTLPISVFYASALVDFVNGGGSVNFRPRDPLDRLPRWRLCSVVQPSESESVPKAMARSSVLSETCSRGRR